MKAFVLLSALAFPMVATAQAVSNITCTPPEAAQVMKGLYDPADFAATEVIDDHATILCELRTRLSADSLRGHLEHIVGFDTRHSFSDTLSAVNGIGAARRWAYDRFAQFSAENSGRLIPGYLSFDYLGDDCGEDGLGWRDVFAVLPGSNVANPSIVLIEAHLDSRCADPCDHLCSANGADDNGSGSALVLELARVMSRYTFDHTIVFMLTTGEEQGLVGAKAMAEWCVDNDVAIKAVQNNDIVGGIWCGATSSAPGCPTEGEVDSLQVRLFSNGSIPRPHRGFARSIKRWYQEKLQNNVPVPMTIGIMGVEDRENRGGDHIPFRERYFRNVRFTSANEHGDANTADTTYHDRQHTSGDVLGVDTDGDLVVDSFFVDFNYLQRNTLINGMAATLLALGPEPPEFTILDEPDGLRVAISGAPEYVAYRIGVRTTSANLDFDAVYRTTDTVFLVPGQVAGTPRYISVAGIDADGITSPFGAEANRTSDADTPPAPLDDLAYGIPCTPIAVPEPTGKEPGIVLSCAPQPFSHHTDLLIGIPSGSRVREATFVVHDALGREAARQRMGLWPGRNIVPYEHQAGGGLFFGSLWILGRSVVTTRLMVVE